MRLRRRQRDVLSEKNPDALTPEWLQKRCRESHPDWAKIRKSAKSGAPGIEKRAPRKAPTPSRKSAKSRSPGFENPRPRARGGASCCAAASVPSRAGRAFRHRGLGERVREAGKRLIRHTAESRAMSVMENRGRVALRCTGAGLSPVLNPPGRSDAPRGFLRVFAPRGIQIPIKRDRVRY